jgi:hypothetical protein
MADIYQIVKAIQEMKDQISKLNYEKRDAENALLHELVAEKKYEFLAINSSRLFAEHNRIKRLADKLQ